MQFFLLTCSKAKNDFLKTGESEYFQRINQLASIKLIEIAIPESINRLPEEQRIEREAELMLAKVKPDTLLVALDENGRQVTSQQFANLIDKEFINGCKSITFVVGGPYGLGQQVLQAAKHKLALSQMTFTSQLARLLLSEQIYRALSIIRNLPYHKN